MYIEEVLNKGYHNDSITAARIYLEDPSLTFDLSKVSLDGGEELIDQNKSLVAKLLQWNRLGVPVGLNGSSGPALITIPNRAKESIVSLQYLGTPNPFLIYIPNTNYTGALDTNNNELTMEVGKSYRLQFWVKFNNCTSSTFSFFEDTAAEWYNLYGLTFSNPTESITDTEFRWHSISTDIEKVEEGSTGTSKVMLNISNFTTVYPERAMLALISGLNIVEII